MLSGTDALWRLWLGFFREHFAAIMSLVVLLPLSLYINWRLAVILFALCVDLHRADHAAWCARPTACRCEVEEHYSDLSARASDALGNVALVQSFVRIDMRGAGAALRRRQAARRADAGAVLVGAGHRDHARLHHHHGAGDLHRRHRAAWPGPHHGRRDRDVRLVRDHADPEARAGGELHQQRVHGSAAPAAILRRARCGARGARPPRRGRHRPALRPRRVQRRLLLL